MTNLLRKNFSVFFFLSCWNFSFAQLNADFTSDKTSGCGTLGVNFTDLSTGSPTSWLWDFGDLTPTSNQQNPGHFYSSPGNYTVTLTVSNSGNSDTETKNLYIQVFAFPVTDFTQNDTLGCAPFTVSFTDLSSSSSSSLVSWLWNFGDGNNATQKNPTHTYTAPGTYTVSLFATDDYCTGTKIKTGLITVLSAINAAFSMNSSFSCTVPFTASFTNSSSSGNGFTYQWDFGDSSPLSNLQNPPPHTYTTFGNYTITLIVSNPAGCSDTISQTLSINPFSAEFSATDSSGCSPFSTVFSVENQSATSFVWTFQGGTPGSSTSASPSINYSTPGFYDVMVIAGNAQGCTDTVTMDNFISVFPLPTVNFSADDSNACKAPFSVNFSSIAPAATSWSWSFSGGSPSTSPQENPSVTYNAAGTYDVSLTVTDSNGCSKTKSLTGFIKITYPVANFNASPLKGCKPLQVVFSNTSTSSPPANQWQWDFGDPASGANNSSSIQSPSHTYNDSGVYDIQLIITNAEGCTDTVVKNNFVMVGMQPNADFIPKDTSGCHPFSVPFTNLSSSFTDEWKWVFTNGSTTLSSTAFNPTQTFTDTGFFDVILISYHHGCPDTVTVDSAVYVKPAKPVFTASPTIFCETDTPYTVTFTDASQGAENWTWKFGDGTPDFSGSSPPPHNYILPGIFTIWLVVDNFTSGCTDSVSKTVSISDIDVGFSTDTNSGCKPVLINFSDTSSCNTSITSKKWFFGDGINTGAGMGSNNITGVSNTSGTFSNPKHTYTGQGFFSVSLIITDQLGCKDTLTIDSLINSRPAPIADFTADTANGCVPLIVQFSDNSNSPIAEWDWDFGNLNTDSVGNPTDTYNLRGQYTVQLIVKDSFNCVDTVVKTNFINATFPYTNFSVADDTICNSGSTGFTNSTTGAGLTYLWDFGDGSAIETSASPSHTFMLNTDASVVLNVMLTATDSNGCDSTMVKPVMISVPDANFYTGAQNAFCPPFDALFVDSSSSDIVSWQWDFGDGSPSIIKTTPDAAHTYESAGFYDVSVVATNNIGCKDTLAIDSLIRVSGPSGSFTFSLDSSRCFSKVDFVATTFNASSITWDFRDGVTSTNSIVTHFYETEGLYVPVLILKDTNGCEVFIVASDTIVISLESITAFISPDTNMVYPETSITFAGASSSSAPVVLWEWIWGDGDSATSADNTIKHEYNSTGDYRVILKITDEDGCSAVFDTLITIVDGLYISNIFTPNGDGLNDVFLIKRNGMKEHSIIIFNRWGEKIFENTSPEIQWGGKNFSGADVTEGTYFYILSSTRENGEVIEKQSFITIMR